ncbi:MAG: 2,3-bisphosphoglycerate-independent phosphoglycerate mutase [Armatimonadetes bacterium]|nr:2,3-bisphosphoglycerate-independent phosphoglycerate mutase [Armatimonadota bacterium]
MKNKVLLLILDGFGINKSKYGNAIAQANTCNYDKFKAENPHTVLKCSGLSVGLPEGVMGNSEVGHLNIGAGRIVFQLNTYINKKIKDKSFFDNPGLMDAVKHVKKYSSKLHLFGLLSDGNVHSHNTHLWALLKMLKEKRISQVYLHAFMDGRDTLPHSGIHFMREFIAKTREIGIGKIATISGRYYAMDRDNRWERIEKAYNAIVYGKGGEFTDTVDAIRKSYDTDITDEFITPKVIIENGKPVASVEENDAVIFFNFRSDRARQITRVFIQPEFDKFQRKEFQNLKYITFSEYDIQFNPFVEVCFRLPILTNILGEVISKQGLKQLRLAETEKYAHVTFFFNGGKEEPFLNEDRILVPSPKVATYDLQPEMSAYIVKDKLVEALKSEKYDLIITNFANCDMLGHTGVFKAAVAAVEAVNKCLEEIIPAAKKHNYNIILTSDHGNAEKMLNEIEQVFTAHSTNDVPLVLSLTPKEKPELKTGKLADIAPLILKIMNIKQPEEMTGKCLICD